MSLAGLSLRDLEYLVAVADAQHFGRAAARCAVSQPALSTQVRKLEAWLGVALFERSPGGVLVTPAGATVVAHARAVLTEAGALVAAARASVARTSGPFRLGVIPTLGPYLLPYVLRPFRERFPELRLFLSEARTAELTASLLAGELDAMLLCPLPADPSITAHPLFFEPFLLAHPAGQPVRWPVQGAGSGLLLLEEGHCLRDQAMAFCAAALPQARRQAVGLEILRHMVAAGEGWTLMPALAARAAPGLAGLVTYAPVADPDVGREVALLTRASNPRRTLIAEVAALLRDSVPPPVRPLVPERSGAEAELVA